MPATASSRPLWVEPLEALKARYPRALRHTFDTLRIIHQGDRRPAESPECIFNFGDGLRLIVSREMLPEGRHVVHVSASFQPESRLAEIYRHQRESGGFEAAVKAFVESVPLRFAELSGDARPLVFLGVSDGLIPHWHIQE